MTVRADGSAAPGQTAYLALLAATTLGTVSSTVMSAPLNEIAAALQTGARGIVLAVSVFTVAMVLTSPAAGWLADRLGPRRYLLLSLGLMVLGQLGAALAQGLGSLVAARGVQGVACAGIPACVQALLAAHWPHRRRQAMAAWASAIGLGQAVGPPVGGLVAQLAGWRWVFGAAALIVVLVSIVLARQLPEAPAVGAPMDPVALVLLSLGAGLLAVGLTGAGQGWTGPSLLLTAAGVLLLVLVLRPGRRPSVLGAVGRDPEYAVATLGAAAAMAGMGITLVSVPVYLGRTLGLGPGLIGLSTLAIAGGMTTFSPVAGWLAGRLGTRRTLAAGLLGLGVGALVLGVVEGRGQGPEALGPVLVVLVLIGCGIATVQSMSAVLLLGVPGISGSAMGVHNTGRFAGLCLGYAWVALVLPWEQPLVIHLGTACLALVALGCLLLLAVRRARERRAGSAAPAPTGR